MTRLIDADEMLKRLESWNTDDEMDKALYNFTLSRIIEQPTVDAIPVSYIQQRIDRLKLLAEYEFESSGGYTGKAHTQMYELRRLINYWKAERNKHD